MLGHGVDGIVADVEEPVTLRAAAGLDVDHVRVRRRHRHQAAAASPLRGRPRAGGRLVGDDDVGVPDPLGHLLQPGCGRDTTSSCGKPSPRGAVSGDSVSRCKPQAAAPALPSAPLSSSPCSPLRPITRGRQGKAGPRSPARDRKPSRRANRHRHGRIRRVTPWPSNPTEESRDPTARLPHLGSPAGQHRQAGDLVTIMSCGGCHTRRCPWPERPAPGRLRHRLRRRPVGGALPARPDPGPGDRPRPACEQGRTTVKALRTGERPDGRELAPMMPWRCLRRAHRGRRAGPGRLPAAGPPPGPAAASPGLGPRSSALAMPATA